MAGRLAGKVAAITGGNQGIGLGIAQRFIADGATVSICYLNNSAASTSSSTMLASKSAPNSGTSPKKILTSSST